MTQVTRRFLIALLMFPIAGGLAAQQTTTAPATPTAAEATGTPVEADAAAAPAVPATVLAAPQNSYEVRDQLTRLVLDSAPELGTIIALQPDLLSNTEFMAAHPELAKFVAEHPEVKSRPRFFFAQFGERRPQEGPLEQIAEPLAAMGGILLLAVSLAWLVRTFIEQRRWSRLSKTQAEVHNKILDRFGTSAELLEYIRTPAGTKFLESAPIPLHAERPALAAPHSRVVLSIQAGVIVVAVALGMLLISSSYSDDSGKGLFALGVIALCLGLGFIASAFVALFLSRRLGLWQPPQHAGGVEEPGS